MVMSVRDLHVVRFCENLGKEVNGLLSIALLDLSGDGGSAQSDGEDGEDSGAHYY